MDGRGLWMPCDHALVLRARHEKGDSGESSSHSSTVCQEKEFFASGLLRPSLQDAGAQDPSHLSRPTRTSTANSRQQQGAYRSIRDRNETHKAKERTICETADALRANFRPRPRHLFPPSTPIRLVFVQLTGRLREKLKHTSPHCKAAFGSCSMVGCTQLYTAETSPHTGC